jgi:hypothetical protein
MRLTFRFAMMAAQRANTSDCNLVELGRFKAAGCYCPRIVLAMDICVWFVLEKTFLIV